MRESSRKNVLMKDGTVRRVPEDQCEHLLSTGQAKRYISNTVYRAMKLGIEVKNPGTRDEDGRLRSKIRAAKEEAEAKRHKAEKKAKKNKKAKEEAEVELEGAAAQ